MSARLQTVQRESNQLQQQVNGKEREIVNLRKEMETGVQSNTPKDDKDDNKIISTLSNKIVRCYS